MPVSAPGLGLEPAISEPYDLILFVEVLEGAASVVSASASWALRIRCLETWERI